MKLKLPGPNVPWTKAPNVLLDILLPSLRDTELRVLLILLRQTVGWNREGRPVILSYKTLMKRTGRHSEAIANALTSLSTKGLIQMRRTKLPPRFRKAKKLVPKTEQQQYTEK